MVHVSVKAVPGDEVTITALEVRGGVCVRSVSLGTIHDLYEVSYFNNGAHQVAWLHAPDIEPTDHGHPHRGSPTFTNGN